MKELSEKKKEFEEVSQALKDARERGYGVMKPVLSEITLSEPEVVKHGNKYGVKIPGRGTVNSSDSGKSYN